MHPATTLDECHKNSSRTQNSSTMTCQLPMRSRSCPSSIALSVACLAPSEDELTARSPLEGTSCILSDTQLGRVYHLFDCSASHSVHVQCNQQIGVEEGQKLSNVSEVLQHSSKPSPCCMKRFCGTKSCEVFSGMSIWQNLWRTRSGLTSLSSSLRSDGWPRMGRLELNQLKRRYNIAPVL